MALRDWVFLISFALVAISGIVLILTELRYRKYITTQAQITSVERESDDGDIVFYAVYTYRDTVGREFTGNSNRRRHMSPFHAGQIITVLYPPETPEKSTINSFREKYAWALFMFGLGIFVAILGFLAR